MPELQNNKGKIERFYLPSTEDLIIDDENKAWVDMEVGGLVAGDLLNVKADSGEMEIAIQMLCARIKDWNFTEAGVKLPITEDVVKLLDIADFTYLTKQFSADVSSLSASEKKA